MRTRHYEALEQSYTPSGKQIIAIEALMFGIAILALTLHLS